jgi:hypothetical protein
MPALLCLDTEVRNHPERLCVKASRLAYETALEAGLRYFVHSLKIFASEHCTTMSADLKKNQPRTECYSARSENRTGEPTLGTKEIRKAPTSQNAEEYLRYLLSLIRRSSRRKLTCEINAFEDGLNTYPAFP